MYLLLTSLLFAVLANCLPLHGYHSCAAPFVRHSGKTLRSLIFGRWWFLGSIALFSLHVRES